MKNVLEIGSEFWNNQYSSVSRQVLKFGKRKKGFLCGRTALDYIICDAKHTIGFSAVLLPSYCCHTMIEPFVKKGIKVRFYSVVIGKGGLECHLPTPKDDEALYLMTYFGFGQINIYNHQQISQWKFCILDETHSCFSDYIVPYSEWNIKYSYISYRKWADIKGLAIAEKIEDDFQLTFIQKRHTRYFEKKNEACTKKQAYIESGIGEKVSFLELFEEAEELLETDYEGYIFLEEGVKAYEYLDINKVKEKRRENAGYLLERLSEIKEIQLLYSSIDNGCPLFVPILVKNGLRNNLRAYLIDNEIYCPIHWPISEFHSLHSLEQDIYIQELSIICDQRYSLSDMQRIVDCILGFFECK
ncbi:MAG: hypothetical protein HFH67_06750 [Lachnospiraceae bacterium]|nr:hypothetical protein [Lachnospiraceae bacterium]